MPVVSLVQGMISLIQDNIIAKTNLVSDVLTGEILVNVENSFHFCPQQEIVIIDYGYNDPLSPHYQIFEYAVVQEVNNTHWITLTSNVVSATGWLVSDHAFIQKTIGHSPLYDDRVFYGDREVIVTEEMAVTVEPQSLSNEWIYLQGGLSEEYRVGIMVYGKDIDTDEGMQILNKYTDAIYDLFNRNIHIDVTNFDAPLQANVIAGTNMVIVENNADNLRYFLPSNADPTNPIAYAYQVQDNLGIEPDLWLDSVDSISTPGELRLMVYHQNPLTVIPGFNNTLQRSYSTAEYAVFSKQGRYFYDSRIDNVEYGMVQKGSAFVRAARLNWFGKEVTEFRFPQRSDGVGYFPEVTP